MPTCSTGFDWYSDDGRVLVPNQSATAVYWGPGENIVIRQESRFEDEEDVAVVLNKTAARAIALRVLYELDEYECEGSGGDDGGQVFEEAARRLAPRAAGRSRKKQGETPLLEAAE
ncbi:MAG TPA: hypothetical protein VGV14_10515 [Rhodanobacter sp.]|nr:hypothetical protein [Rhodanobacter sp.]